MNYKYDSSAYHSDNDRWNIISVENLIEQYSENDKLFYKKYKQRLYCPECKQVLLSFVDSKDKKQHLRAYPNLHHADTCSYSLDEVSPQQFETYLSDNKNIQAIQNRLRAMIHMLLRNEELNTNPLVITIEQGAVSNNDVPRNIVLSKKQHRSIPNKSLTAPFDRADYNIWKLFYGKVNIRWRHKKFDDENIKYSLDLYNTSTNKYICTLNMKKLPYYWFEKQNSKICSVETTKNVYISFASVMKEKDGFKNADIIHSELLIIEAV